jgi:hypothetical protein
MCNIDFNYLKEGIIDKKTIIMIGPSLTINYKDSEFEKNELLGIMNSSSREEIISINENDNLLMFKDKLTKSRYSYKIKKIYEQSFENEVLHKLTEIPFHTYFQVTPDKTLESIFEKKNFDYFPEYYSFAKMRICNFTSTPEKPAIYNFYGSVKEVDSLIFSHFDLFLYIKSLSQNLSEFVKSSFNYINTKNVIFIGFEFNKWYYQLILSLLSNEFEKLDNFSNKNENLKNEIEIFCKNHFNITFVNCDVSKFTDELYNMFNSKELRKPKFINFSEKKYNLENINTMLSECFSDTDISGICMHNFYKVYNNFTIGQSKQQMILELMAYVTRQLKIDELLNVCASKNEKCFEKYKPYY